MKHEEIQKKWSEIVAKAWIDEKFKKELLANPSEVLKKHGFSFSGSVKILESTKNNHYFVLPPKPEGKLSEQDLRKIAAASLLSNPSCQSM